LGSFAGLANGDVLVWQVVPVCEELFHRRVTICHNIQKHAPTSNHHYIFGVVINSLSSEFRISSLEIGFALSICIAQAAMTFVEYAINYRVY
jgi:hypothetical protein